MHGPRPARSRCWSSWCWASSRSAIARWCAWALAPPRALLTSARRALFLTLGTVAPAHTARSLLLLLTYAGAYLLVVNLVRTRAQLDRLVSTLLAFGGLLAFLGLLDYLAREVWLLRWRSAGHGAAVRDLRQPGPLRGLARPC